MIRELIAFAWSIILAWVILWFLIELLPGLLKDASDRRKARHAAEELRQAELAAKCRESLDQGVDGIEEDEAGLIWRP